MTPARDLLLRLDHQGVKCRVDQGILKCSAAPGVMTDELRQRIREHKAEMIRMLLHPEDAPEPFLAMCPDDPHAGDHRSDTAASIAQCPRCRGTHWGPVAPAIPEVLRTGEEVLTEVWDCLDCAARPAGTPAPPVPESAYATPPWATPSPCPECSKSHRLFVKASPHIEGEPARDALICSQCGHSELACSECKRSNVVTDSLGTYCVDCRKRPGQPKPEPVPCSAPPLVSSRRHHLGEPPPTFDCPDCADDTWLEGIYSWRCKACQNIVMKPDGTWPPRLPSSPDTSRGIPFPVQEEVL